MQTMKKTRGRIIAIAALALLWAAAPVGADQGAGELNASFHAFGGGGLAILNHSEVAPNVASAQNSPEGRLVPFGDDRFICDELVVGTWVIWFADDDEKEALAAVTNQFALDGETLELTRTPIKRFNSDEEKGWWFAEGVPVLGTLDPGMHEIEWTFDAEELFGFGATLSTAVEVDASHC